MGLLVAKTLSNATANPFLAGGTGSYNPVVALDVFLVQARVCCGPAYCGSLYSSADRTRTWACWMPGPPGMLTCLTAQLSCGYDICS